jgi:hypothetical protein
MATRCPRADAFAAATGLLLGAPHDDEARQRQLVRQVLGTDAVAEGLPLRPTLRLPSVAGRHRDRI